MTWNLPDSLIQLKDDNIIDIIIYKSGLRGPGVSTPG